MRLPSMPALRALEAVARLGSVTAAALELNLTRSAISHQITGMEETLGFALTERQGRGISLTFRGERYAREIQRFLANLEDAGRRVDDQEVYGKLCISCSSGFSTYWLCHHIGGFVKEYPQVQLHMVTPTSADDVSNHTADLFISYGIGDWPEMKVEQIAALNYFPVCSPRLINALGGLKTPQDLAAFPLLHMSDYSDWRVWQAAANTPELNVATGIVFSDAHCAQAACIAAQGVAMGDNLLCGDSMAKGLLVRPFDIVINSHRGYYLVTDTQKCERPAVLAFTNWIKTQLQASRQAWVEL
ncbi:MAG: LysR family transcriptional regulator [Pseudomonas putida]|jgi:LysR family glycine cleavage system transcriptional activator|uniref:LysR substrate-binding domain-containing protein n=2 Tax=Pseudomonas TaxID=286 RepID=UPI00281E9F23|nr:LysR family transcriptional regulator [Pseudomonas putida]